MKKAKASPRARERLKRQSMVALSEMNRYDMEEHQEIN